MHELGIVQKIVAAADKAAEKNNIAHVKVLRLRLGQMAAAHPDQMQFGFETYAKGSRLEGAKLCIEDVKVELQCQRCSQKFGDPRFDDHEFAHTMAHAPIAYMAPRCPKCNAENPKIIHGQELELVEIEGE